LKIPGRLGGSLEKKEKEKGDGRFLTDLCNRIFYWSSGSSEKKRRKE